jgi:hypothetical protein
MSKYRQQEALKEIGEGKDAPLSRRADMCSGHSALSLSAPVREPSPPQTTRASIPWRTRLRAAVRRPSSSRKAAQRAVPMRVPPIEAKPRTSSHPTCEHIALVWNGEERGKRKTHANNVPPLKSLLSLTLLQELSLTVGSDETSSVPSAGGGNSSGSGAEGLAGLDVSVFAVSAYETLPSLTDNVSFATTAERGASMR